MPPLATSSPEVSEPDDIMEQSRLEHNTFWFHEKEMRLRTAVK